MKSNIRSNGSINKRWEEPSEVSVPDSLRQAIGGPPLISQIMYRRGFQDVNSARGFLDNNHYSPSSPLELTGIDDASHFLLDAVHRKKRIGIWGDFDVDGQTATTLLVSSLRELNCPVSYYIPVRANETHGLNLTALDRFLNEGIDLLVTCDTGITANTEVDYAQSRGVPVIITDHHDLPPQLPKALAVVNPKFLPNNHPQRNLPGVGVAYQLIKEVFTSIGTPELAESFLDLVAMGIVADLAELRGDTRWLLQQGLKSLRHTSRIGLQMLFEINEINQENITEEHISFYLAPRLNAIGRLSDANKIVEFLTTMDAGKARLMTVEIEGINAQRKLITDQVFQAAQAQIQANPNVLEDGIILLANPAWPSGVIGIVASRLVERYNLPAILFSSPPGQIARGSARSVEGINITELIATQESMLNNFGGHPMAAGIGIDPQRIPEFHRKTIRALKLAAPTVAPHMTLPIDGFVPLAELTLELATQVERLAPFGPGNPAPLLGSKNLKLSGFTTVGRNAEHLLLTVEDEEGFSQKVIWWQGADWPLPQGWFDLAYTVRASSFRGQRDIQVEWVDYRLLDETSIQIGTAAHHLNIVDYRQHDQPLQLLGTLFTQVDLQVWCEALSKNDLPCRDRYKLTPGKQILVILTIPPGPSELQYAIEITSPETLYLCNINPGLDAPETFLKHLSGLLKYALRTNQGNIHIPTIAAAASHRIPTIHAGIAWLQAHGHLIIISQEGDNLNIQLGSYTKSPSAPQTSKKLKSLLDETASFRSYYLRAETEALINLLLNSNPDAI